MNLFSYGSLMFEPVFLQVVGRLARAQSACLQGWSRHAIQGEIYPAALPDPGGSIEGRVWFELTADEVIALDRFETEEYLRVDVVVQVNGVDLPCFVYQWRDRTRLLAQDWSPATFRETGLAGFVQQRSPRD